MHVVKLCQDTIDMLSRRLPDRWRCSPCKYCKDGAAVGISQKRMAQTPLTTKAFGRNEMKIVAAHCIYSFAFESGRGQSGHFAYQLERELNEW